MVRKLDDYLVNLKDDIFLHIGSCIKMGRFCLSSMKMVISRALLLSEN